METIEYRNVINKTTWPRGPWDREPDKKQWRDETTGLPCLIVRGPSGALCGYVGVPSGHPWHGQDTDSVGTYMPKPDGHDEAWYPDVHGGLTFSGACQHGDNPAEQICHIPGPGEPDDVWWLGFDCAHYRDFTPAYGSIGRDDVYRTLGYVTAQVEKLAGQAQLVTLNPKES